VVAEVITPEFSEPYDPHLLLPMIDGNIQVWPVSMLESIVAGDETVLIDKMTIRSIICDWLERIGARSLVPPPKTDAKIIKFPK
jgi:hypothetical protein